jgi:hypothetical protein
MGGKNLKEKAIDIKGKKYVMVSDRVIFFNEIYPLGGITTELISALQGEVVVVKATVTPDITMPTRIFTAYSQAKWGDGMVNKTAALENAETSAVGRALAFMGIGVLDSIASVDEINKATTAKPFTPYVPKYKKQEPYQNAKESAEHDAGNFNLSEVFGDDSEFHGDQ